MAKKDNSIQTIIYVALAFLLLLNLAKMPYGLYQAVRFLAFAGFGYSAYLQYNNKCIDRMILFVVLALLFQPFHPLALGRVIWIIVDVVIVGYLIYLLAKMQIKK